MTENPIAKILEDAARAIVTYRLKSFENAIAGDIVKIVHGACSEIEKLCPTVEGERNLAAQAANYHLMLVEAMRTLQSLQAGRIRPNGAELVGQVDQIKRLLEKGGVS